MAVLVQIPKLGVSMTQGAVVEWYVCDGNAVTVGQPLYLLETEKTQNEVEAPASGTISIECDLDVMYDVGTMIAKIT